MTSRVLLLRPLNFFAYECCVMRLDRERVRECCCMQLAVVVVVRVCVGGGGDNFSQKCMRGRVG